MQKSSTKSKQTESNNTLKNHDQIGFIPEMHGGSIFTNQST